jgi:3-dehydroquinate dehydratase-1
MICTCLSEYDFETCLQVLPTCEMAEIRLDTIPLDRAQIHRLFSQSKVPLIATFRPNGIPDDLRKDALQAAVSAGATYVDIEADASYRTDLLKFATENHCKTILSCHYYRSTPGKSVLSGILKNMDAQHPTYKKIVTYAIQSTDAMRVLALYEEEPNLLAFCMGSEGRSSRVVSYLLGAPFIYAAPDGGALTADGQYTVSQIKEVLRAVNL